MSWAQIIDGLDKAGVVLGWVLAVPVFGTWWQVTLGTRRDRRRLWRQFRERPGQHPAILVVDLLPGKNILAAVERERQRMEELRDLPDERIVKLARNETLTADQMARLHDEIRHATSRLLELGADTVHLFYAGPAVVAAMLGAELSNGPRVLLYHHDGGTYHNFGPLQFHRR